MKMPIVLVLGSSGMTGRYVHSYLEKKYNDNIYGTTRQGNKSLKFSVENTVSDLSRITKKIGHIDFIINCIGINHVSNDNKVDAIRTNSILPILLSDFSNKYKYKLIHISTDAVFHPRSGNVTEKIFPSPDGLYGLTKLLGESNSKNTINFRTSIIGASPKKRTGLVEFVLRNKEHLIDGFVNQKWSGCTALQFAMFCDQLIYKNQFSKLRAKTNIIHFAPLGPVSKHDLISAIISASKKKIKLKSKKAPVTITRYLSSVYFKKDWLNEYNSDIHAALEELFEFERSMKIEN